ncbi:MAG: hypothetical protein R3C19_22405 [Planctomycetaceae bacterium]
MVTFQSAFLAFAASVFVMSAPAAVNAGPPSRLDPPRTQEDVEREEATRIEKGYVKYRNGNWGPPLPPGLRLLEAQGAFAIPAGPKPGPGHRGNIVRFVETIEVRPNGAEALLKSSRPPAARLDYFHELLEHPAYQLDGWDLVVRRVDSVDAKVRLIIYSTPLVTCERRGPIVFVLGWHEETYELRDGKLILVKTAAVGDRPIMGIVGL